MLHKLILFGILILQLSTLTYCYVEALTANLDNGLTHFQPMVAMLCGQHGKFHNQYLNEQKQWVTDNDPSATCIKDKLEILEYCRKVYPKKDIRNIVESNHYYKIDSWKSVKSSSRHRSTNDKQHFVKPIRCLEGNFQSDALLVPEHCVFDHIHNSSVCEANAYWNKTANLSCKDKGKMLQSYAMLLPCGVGIFNGVEFVCCPTSTSNQQNEISDRLPPYTSNVDEAKTNERLIKSNSKKLFNKKQRYNKLDQEENEDYSSMEDDSDYHSENNTDQDIKYEDDFNSGKSNKEQDTLPRKASSGKKMPKAKNLDDDYNEGYDDDDDEDYSDYEQGHKGSSTTTTTTTTETPLEHYYSHFDSKSEHDLFKQAEESLRRIQLEKMKKVFKDYAEFQTKISEKNMKKSKRTQKKSDKNDESEIDENLRKKMEKRYEDALESLEMQNNEEKQQLNAMHQQRVLTLINMKKQEATDCYTSSLNQTPRKPKKVQKCLEKLMKSLDKDRVHTLHHYKHLLQVSSKLALKEKVATLTHLENLIVIANRSISMLNKYPTLNEKIGNHIIAFWHNLRGVPFNEVISRETEQQIMEKYEEEIAQKQQEKEHRKMMQEVKKEEEKERETSTKKDETKEIQHKTSALSLASESSKQNLPSTVSTSLEEKIGTSKINASNIKYTARYSANSKSTKQLGKQVNQLHQAQQQKPIVSNMQHSRQHHEVSSFKLSEQLPEQHHLTNIKFENKNSYMTYGIAGVVIVLLATVCGIIIYRSGSQQSHLSQGFVALKQQQHQPINEQENVESLQINGYENPTYRWIEKNVV